MVDPFGATGFADTLLAAVEAGESTAISGGAVGSWIEMVLARRPIWAAQAAALEFAKDSAATAPLWRWVQVAGPLRVEAVRGTSLAATTSGVASLALTLGVPLVAAVGVWVMLGSGYYQARKEIRRKGFMSGFSQGFTMGVLKWDWHQAVQRFAKRFVIRRNAFDSVMDREEALGYNEGLIKGWAAGSAVWEKYYDARLGKVVDKKKAYRIALRRLADRHDSSPWSANEDMARLQQVDYVINLAAAGLKHGLIVPEFLSGWVTAQEGPLPEGL
jgi:hypothetical protein